MTAILVVEDNRVNLRMLTFTLKKANFTVLAAGDGLEALEQLAQHPVDLLIFDIDMPRMDGITLLRHLRAQADFSRLPAIALTASGEDNDYRQCQQAGANEILTKPTSSHQLLEAVNRVLGATI